MKLKTLADILERMLAKIDDLEADLAHRIRTNWDVYRNEWYKSEYYSIYDYLPEVKNITSGMKAFYRHPLKKLDEACALSAAGEKGGKFSHHNLTKPEDLERWRAGADERYKIFLKNEVKRGMDLSRAGLERAVYSKLDGLEIAKIKEISLRAEMGMIEGDWMITLADGRIFRFHTHSIIAGGYNIQRLHYRYLSNIKEQK